MVRTSLTLLSQVLLSFYHVLMPSVRYQSKLVRPNGIYLVIGGLPLFKLFLLALFRDIGFCSWDFSFDYETLQNFKAVKDVSYIPAPVRPAIPIFSAGATDKFKSLSTSGPPL